MITNDKGYFDLERWISDQKAAAIYAKAQAEGRLAILNALIGEFEKSYENKDLDTMGIGDTACHNEKCSMGFCQPDSKPSYLSKYCFDSSDCTTSGLHLRNGSLDITPAECYANSWTED